MDSLWEQQKNLRKEISKLATELEGEEQFKSLPELQEELNDLNVSQNLKIFSLKNTVEHFLLLNSLSLN